MNGKDSEVKTMATEHDMTWAQVAAIITPELFQSSLRSVDIAM